MVPTASLVVVLAGATLCASEQQIAWGVDLFDSENESVAEYLYNENNNRDYA